jgi:hypothetical protein
MSANPSMIPFDRRCVLSIYRPVFPYPTRSTPVKPATVLLRTVTIYLISCDIFNPSMDRDSSCNRTIIPIVLQTDKWLCRSR